MISKEKLYGELLGAQTECAIHSQLEHPNVCKMLGYTETEKDFILLLEHMNEACLLKETIVEQRT